MPDEHGIPGLDADVYFGDAERPLPNWRDHVEPETEDDPEDVPLSEEDRAALVGVLGFDPADLDDDDGPASDKFIDTDVGHITFGDETPERYAKDAAGHEHDEKGLFTGNGGGASGGLDDAERGKVVSGLPKVRSDTPNISLPESARPQLDPDEQIAARWYAGPGYIGLNRSLRQGHGLPPLEAKLDGLLQAAIAKTKPFKKPITVSRGIELEPDAARAFIAKVMAAKEAGKPMKIGGYTSTTTNPGLGGFNGSIIFKIKATHGLDMRRFSGNPDENELLLDKDCQFKIKGIAKEGNTYRVRLEQVPATGGVARSFATARPRRYAKDATGHEHDSKGLFTGNGDGNKWPSPEELKSHSRTLEKEALGGVKGTGIKASITRENIYQVMENQEAASFIPIGSSFLGSGTEAVAFKSPAGDVFRLELDRGPRPDIPEILQPIASTVTSGDNPVRVEQLPFAKKVPKAKQAEAIVALHESLKAKGYVWKDDKPRNIGLVDGKIMIIDPGNIERVADNDIARSSAHARPKRYAAADATPIVAYAYPGGAHIALGPVEDVSRWAEWAKSQSLLPALTAFATDGHTPAQGGPGDVQKLVDELRFAARQVDPTEGIGPIVRAISDKVLAMATPDTQGIAISEGAQ